MLAPAGSSQFVTGKVKQVGSGFPKWRSLRTPPNNDMVFAIIGAFENPL